MGKFDGFLLMSDFDRTLSHDMQISPENCDAIRYFQSEGGLFALASGRRPGWGMKWADFVLPNTWCAMLNGAVLCDNTGENAIYKQPIEDDYFDLAKRIVAVCPELDRIHFINYNDSVIVNKSEDLNIAAAITEPVYKMLFHTPAELSDEYTAKITALAAPHCITMRSWINGIEVQKAGTGKGDAVRRLREILGDRVHTVVAAGDYENDIDMIKAADIGYAVENAVPSLKAVADRVTVSCEKHALAHIIEDLS